MKFLRNVVIGKEYQVPCVETIPTDNKMFMPIIPVIHTDNFPDLDSSGNTNNIIHRHYHIDTRFVQGSYGDAYYDLGQPIFYRKLRCFYDDNKLIREADDLWLGMYKMLVEHSNCKNICNTCPHNNMPIINGVCTGHGLKWKDGELKHKPPYYLRIVGTECMGEITSIDEEVKINIEKYNKKYLDNEIKLEMLDKNFDVILLQKVKIDNKKILINKNKFIYISFNFDYGKANPEEVFIEKKYSNHPTCIFNSTIIDKPYKSDRWHQIQFKFEAKNDEFLILQDIHVDLFNKYNIIPKLGTKITWNRWNNELKIA